MNEFIKSHLTVDRLLESYKLVTAGCRWKSAVQRFGHDKLSLCVQLYDDIMNDRYKTLPPQKFVIFERGKKRVISNLVMRDKVLQRFLCDYCLVPYLDRFFIYDNSASRKGKGVHFARERVKSFMRRYYQKYGQNGYVLQIDFSKYFDTIDHETLINILNKYIPAEPIFDDILNMNGGLKGLDLGSQVSQIAGILYLSSLDDFIKIVNGCKYYHRYMDDLIIIHNSKDYLREMLQKIQEYIKPLKLTLNGKKVFITKIRHFIFLKTHFYLSESGSITTTPVKSTLQRHRQKIKRMKYKLPYHKNLLNYKSWRGNLQASFTNTYHAIKESDRQFSTMFKSEEMENDRCN